MTRRFLLPLVAVMTIIAMLMPGCTLTTTYELTMAEDPAVGGTATDVTNASPYTSGAVIDITAAAATGYTFSHWSAPAGTFGDANDPTTTFTMPAQAINVTANFEKKPPDHFAFYMLDSWPLPYVEDVVYLEDQFTALETTVGYAAAFGNPAQKVHGGVTTPSLNPDHHLTFYAFDLEYDEEWEEWHVEVDNQFGTQKFSVFGPVGLIVPTQKEDHDPPVGLDHYMIYAIIEIIEGPSDEATIGLQDQFVTEEEVVVYEPVLFANPVRKTHGNTVTEILNPDDHFVGYMIDGGEFEGQVTVVDQFGELTLNVYGPLALLVPSQKIDWSVPVYDLTLEVEPPESGVATDLTDASPYTSGTVVNIQATAASGYQFSHWSAEAGMFDDPDSLMTTFTMPAQHVTVFAHFDPLPPPPLDHFRAYGAEDVTGLPVGEPVLLEDQFGSFEAVVEWAMLFCNPVEKIHDGLPTPISDPDHHLTIYEIDVSEWQEWYVEVDNQFGTQQFTVSGPVGLAVPTEKAGHEPPGGLDHYLIYEIIGGSPVNVPVDLFDQFLDQPGVMVYEPVLFANPVRKTHDGIITEIENPDAHLVFYSTDPGPFMAEIPIFNQFDLQTLTVGDAALLGVPSEKIEPALANVAVLGDYDSQLTALLWANNIMAEDRGWDVISDIANYDAVVVNSPYDPGSADFLDFLDAADAAGVGVVFTSSWSVSNPWGIQLLQLHLDDPANHDYSCCYGDVYYKVTEAHPIFDGWSVGDEITIITGGDNDHSWFSGYSGTTIAQVGSASGGLQGDAVAVGSYGGSTHVLLASLGPQSWTDESVWTDDARTIFVNAVLFAVSGGI